MFGHVHLGEMREGLVYTPVGKGLFQAEARGISQKFFARDDRRQIVLQHDNLSQREAIESFEALLTQVSGRPMKLEQRFVLWKEIDWLIVSIHSYDIYQFEQCVLDHSYRLSHRRYEHSDFAGKVQYFPHGGLHFRSLEPVPLDYTKN